MHCFHWGPVFFVLMITGLQEIIYRRGTWFKKKKGLWRCKEYYQEVILYTEFKLRKYS